MKGWLLAHGGRRAWALGAAALTLVALMTALRGAGLTDDDDFYAPAAMSYARWLGRALTFQSGVFSQPEIDAAFAPNHEHPPMAKYVMGVSRWLFSDLTHLLPTIDGARAGVCILAALLAYVVASLGFMLRGRMGAVTAVLCLFLLPRFFFHSLVATLDVPVASLTTLAGYLAFRARKSTPHMWAAGVAFGCALLTKLNAPFLIVAILIHWLMGSWRGFRLEEGKLRLPPLPLVVLVMLGLGVPMFFIFWPHLWFDTINRLGAYLAFHLNHYPIYLYYLGILYTQTIAPWHAPWVMAASVVPVTILALMLLGGGQSLRSTWLMLRAGQSTPMAESEEDERTSLRVFLFIQAFIAIGIVSFTGVPKYGGEKLFMPFFPLMAVLAVDGAAQVADGLVQPWPTGRRWLTWLPTVVVALHGAWALASVWPFNLSYYGEAILGPRGAEAIGMENTYYDVADKKLVQWMNDNAPTSAKVHFEPNHKEYVRTWNWLARDGYLRRDILTADEASSDFVVHEQEIGGVKLYTVYRRK